MCVRLTVIIWALSSADMEEGFGFPLKSLWKACIAHAVTSFEHKERRKNKLVYNSIFPYSKVIVYNTMP